MKSLIRLVRVGRVTRLLRVRWGASRSSTSTHVPAGTSATIACWSRMIGLVCQADQNSRMRGVLVIRTAGSMTGTTTIIAAIAVAAMRLQSRAAFGNRPMVSTAANSRIRKIGAL